MFAVRLVGRNVRTSPAKVTPYPTAAPSLVAYYYAVPPKDKGKGRATPSNQTLTMALKWVQDILDLKDKMDSVWAKSFESNPKIEATLNEVSIGLLHGLCQPHIRSH